MAFSRLPLKWKVYCEENVCGQTAPIIQIVNLIQFVYIRKREYSVKEIKSLFTEGAYWRRNTTNQTYDHVFSTQYSQLLLFVVVNSRWKLVSGSGWWATHTNLSLRITSNLATTSELEYLHSQAGVTENSPEQ